MGAVMLLTRTGRQAANGCEQLKLELYRDGRPAVHKDGSPVDPIYVVSGWRGCQNFRTRADQVVGRCEPIPEGVYRLSEVYWAGRAGDWETIFPDIRSACCIEIDPARKLLAHLDAQDDGTAGCVGTRTNEDLGRIVWWREHEGADTLIADHGLGTVERPRAPGVARALHRLQSWVHPRAARARIDGREAPDLVVQLRFTGGKVLLELDGKQRELVALSLDGTYKI